MATVIFILCFALLFLILSIFLLNGKGKWLIAGYNTASEEERKKYDEKKICRAIGLVCAVCSIMLCIMAYMGYRVESGLITEEKMLPFGLIFAGVILLSVISAVIYINTKAKK